MNSRYIIERLDDEYDRTSGFIGLLRNGVFSQVAADRFLDALRLIEVRDDQVALGIVRHLWFSLMILNWQRPRLSVEDSARLDDCIDTIENILESRIGVP